VSKLVTVAKADEQMRATMRENVRFLARVSHGLGTWLIVLGVLLNEQILKRMFSRDGVLEPTTRLIVWTFDVLAVICGLGLRAIRSRVITVAEPSSRRRLGAPSMGCLISAGAVIGLIACGEGVCGWLNHRVSLDVKKEENEYHAIIDQSNSALGYRLIPKRTAHVFAKVNGRVVIGAVYTTDEIGRRQTPGPPKGDAAGTLLFFGDSFTFGEWVNDDETMPFTVSQLAPQYQVYNYGVPGYGTQHVLAKLEDSAIVREFDAVPPVTGVYTFIDGHVPRVIGTMRNYASWMADCPCYDLDASGAGVVRKGSFRTGRPWRSRLYGFFGHSQILQYFNLDWPFHFTPRDVNLTCRIIEASRDRFQALFGSDRFYVLFYPGSNFAARMIPRLAAQGVRTLDYSKLIDWSDTRYQIPVDGHPTAQTHRLIASHLVNDLKLLDGAAPSDADGSSQGR